MVKSVVLGAGGFIGGHLVTKLKEKGDWVRGVDIKRHEHKESDADEFILADLRKESNVDLVIDDSIDFVYQLAADMGGAEYIFTGDNDADIMYSSAMINLHVCNICSKKNVKKVFYSSSACIYPEHNQLDPENPNCEESSAYPADPDSEYGWEKLFSERVFLAFMRNYGIIVRVARYHNIFGPEGTWEGGREKAPAAMCRKAAFAKDGESIEVWGPGTQTRSFLFIDECIEATIRFMRSDFEGPVNIGSEEMISMNEFARMAINVSGKQLDIYNIDGDDFLNKYGHKCPIGVNGRNSDNSLYFEKVGWKVSQPLLDGMQKTFKWINEQVSKK